MTERRIIKLVEALIDEFNTIDPFIICDNLNIEVKYKYLGDSKGYYTYSNNMCAIFINNVIEYFEKKAICAHELGHALLHTNTNIRFMTECTFFSKNKYEREANLFAANFLLYDLDERIINYEDYSHFEIAIVEGVPIEFIKLRLGTL